MAGLETIGNAVTKSKVPSVAVFLVQKCFAKASKVARRSTAVSSIEDVRAAEKRVQKILEALKQASARDPNNLAIELQKATDDYARAVRELNST
jgi:hypothetical protein